MKKYLVVLSLSLGLLVSSVSADALKNSLTNMLNEKDTSPSMVNLSNLNINGKAKPVQNVPKTRSSKAVVATVNGHKILKKEADAHLKKRTQGKMSNFDHLPKKQRLRLIQEMALPVLALDSAQKELSAEEKEAVYSRLWMQKEVLKIKITDEQVKKIYDQLKQRSEENNTTANIPAFESVKDKMKLQMKDKQMVGNLMKDVEIKVQ
ncbi:MAG: hypothetical protein B6D54_00955 [Epsilonproteobacteria bacterium 4484_65]|nr:MAG: hypothetical protein B6D54_00955 [Epsilonproteobacteria bacterium 4484_65]